MIPQSWIEALALSRVSGVGDRLFRNLVDAFGSPGSALGAAPEALASVDGVGPRLAASLRALADRAAAEREARRALDLGFRLLPYGDPGYPSALARIHDPPAVLYAAGSLGADPERAVAIVGSRRASTQGARFAEHLARGLAGGGVTIVSGLAEGIDAAAHRGALAGGGRTVAVFGSGLDVVYPPRHTDLARAVRTTGAWVSELPLGSPPLAHHFPRRNRVISGLAQGVVVVEAAEKSGSLITALSALDQGREVFAVPGLPGAYNSRGAHRLLRMGAKLVECAEDVLEELPPEGAGAAARPKESPPAALTPPSELAGLWEALEAGPLHIDDVAARAGMGAAAASAGLMELCLRGWAEETPGKCYARRTPGNTEIG